MNWTQQPNCLISSCGEYKIINNGKKGGKEYVLYTKHGKAPYPNAYCRLITQGTLEHCKGYLK